MVEIEYTTGGDHEEVNRKFRAWFAALSSAAAEKKNDKEKPPFDIPASEIPWN